MIARFRWRGHCVSMRAPQTLIERVAALTGLECEPGAMAEGWHIEAEPHRLLLPGEYGEYPCETPDDLLVTAANRVPALILTQADGHALHAAAIVKDGKADLILGPRYAGKTTLAVEAWIAGHQIIGDDVVLVDPASGMVEAMPKPMKIRVERAALPAALAGRVPAEAWATGRILGEQVVILSRGLRGMAALGERFEVGRILLIERSSEHSRDRSTRLLPIDKYAAIVAIMEQQVATSKQGLGVLKGLLGRIAGRQIFRLQVGWRETPSPESSGA